MDTIEFAFEYDQKCFRFTPPRVYRDFTLTSDMLKLLVLLNHAKNLDRLASEAGMPRHRFRKGFGNHEGRAESPPDSGVDFERRIPV